MGKGDVDSSYDGSYYDSKWGKGKGNGDSSYHGSYYERQWKVVGDAHSSRKPMIEAAFFAEGSMPPQVDLPKGEGKDNFDDMIADVDDFKTFPWVVAARWTWPQNEEPLQMWQACNDTCRVTIADMLGVLWMEQGEDAILQGLRELSLVVRRSPSPGKLLVALDAFERKWTIESSIDDAD